MSADSILFSLLSNIKQTLNTLKPFLYNPGDETGLSSRSSWNFVLSSEGVLAAVCGERDLLRGIV